MSIIVYNSLSRKKEEFNPIQPKKVGMYSCGPTVYNVPHIGNYRAYLCDDTIARILQYNGFDVNHVMNITDVDDKTIKNANAAGLSLTEFTSHYTQQFLEDLADLNISTITYHPKATLHISEMIDLISLLLNNGSAYKGDDGSIYFSIKSFPSYGNLARLDRQELQADASGRMKNDEYSKESVRDFALWKAWSEEDGDVFWDAAFGKGRPGWHIECSAMSMKYLGSHFDIHAGGVDLLFPHHENEIAQSESATGIPFVNYWLHNEWLLVNGSKMAKSAGNFITYRDIIGKGYDPLAYRFLCLQTHYRQQLNFSYDVLDAAQQGYRNLQNDIQNIANSAAEHSGVLSTHQVGSLIEHTQYKFKEAVNDDFNTPKGLAVVFEFLKHIHQHEMNFTSPDFQLCLNAIYDFDMVLGLGLDTIKHIELPENVSALVRERDSARASRNFIRSDELRTTIESQGYSIEDTSDGSRISKI
ncbi:MAG: cysteine--tRNA ligase [Patescibacteria group bacterium]